MALHTAPRPVSAPVAAPKPPSGPSGWAALGWLAGGAMLTFVLSFLGTTVLGLQHDLYYLIYFTFVLGYLGWFVARSGDAWRDVLRGHLWWSLGVGALVGFAVVRQVMDQVGTPHPGGAFYGFELAWRGVVYGAVDALILCVFPAVVAYLVLRGNRRGYRRKAAFAGLVVGLSLVVTATYHLGYSTYRGTELTKPLMGTVMWDLPAVLTGNPAGALLAHPAVHTTAVVHQYRGGEETNHFLPPELTADYPDQPGGSAALAIATGWLVVAGAVVLAGLRRVAGADEHSPVGSKAEEREG